MHVCVCVVSEMPTKKQVASAPGFLGETRQPVLLFRPRRLMQEVRPVQCRRFGMTGEGGWKGERETNPAQGNRAVAAVAMVD